MAEAADDQTAGDGDRDPGTALVTGCSSGIGHATALAFRDADWTVYATARDVDDVADLADAGCETLALDVTDPTAARDAVEQVLDDEGRIDAVVNNAGIAQYGPVEDVPPRLVREQFDVNVFGPHRLVRAALPHMREQGDGTIVNVSSGLGSITLPGVGVYAGSKHALEAMSDALRLEVAETGVDVVVVQPGLVETAFRDRATASIDELDRTPAYAGLYEALEDRGPVVELLADDREAVADAVLDAASCTDPPPRYPVGVARFAALASLVPERFRTRVLRLVMRLVT